MGPQIFLKVFMSRDRALCVTTSNSATGNFGIAEIVFSLHKIIALSCDFHFI